MIEECVNALLEKAKKKKLIKNIPQAPRAKINLLMEALKKEKIVTETLVLYLFLKKIPKLEHVREAEFRKGVNLKITDNEKVINIDMEKLKMWQELLERFLSFVQHFIK